MKRLFCDRCDREVTKGPTAAIGGIKEADERGDGTVTDAFDHLCPSCYADFIAFMATPPPRGERS